MKITMILFAILAGLSVEAAASGQHGQHQAASSLEPSRAAAAQCAMAQRAVAATLDAAGARLEAARQTNSPAAMRASIDDMEGVLRDVRLKLAACAALPLQAPAADPHAGHPAPGDKR